MRTWRFANFYFFYFATIGIIMPYWSVYLQYLGFNAKEIGQLTAILLITKMLAPNMWASIADRAAAKNGSSLGILKFATAATLAVYVFIYVAKGFWPVAVVMLGFCVFWNASLPQLEAATLNHLSDKRHYGKVRLWGSLGFIATVFSVGLIIDNSGPASIVHAGAIVFLALFMASLLMHDKSATASNQCSQVAVGGLWQALNLKVICLLSLCVLMQMSHAPLQAFMSIYLHDFGYANWQIGALWAVGVVFEILVFIYSYRILQRFRLSTLLTFTFLVAAIRWSLLAMYPNIQAVVLATQIMHAITFGLYHAVMIQIVDRMFRGAYQIRGQALYNSITFGFGGAVGSFVSGYIWTDWGRQQLFLTSGVMMLLVFVISAIFASKLTTLES